MAGDGSETKDLLRARILVDRAAISASERAEAGEALCRHGLAAWSTISTVAAYLEVGAEPPVSPLLDALVADGVEVLLPVISDDNLDWAVYTRSTNLAAGPLGIREPDGPRRGSAALAAADLVIVPALAVDLDGHRLGRGRGFYDRALAHLTAPTVAVVYDTELLDDVPVESHDVPVGAVLRPGGLTSCRPNRARRF